MDTFFVIIINVEYLTPLEDLTKKPPTGAGIYI